MIRNRSMLACVAIVAAIGVGLPGLVAATAGASTEPPPTSAPIEDADGATAPDGTDPGAGDRRVLCVSRRTFHLLATRQRRSYHAYD